MANGTIIHQWKYHGHWTQRWKIELQSNGYHTISSVVSGTKYYLAVKNGSSADGTAIVLKSGATTSDMLWSISKTSLGYYKIAPKVGESINRIMAVVYNSNQSTNGLQIKELTYSNDGHRSDEWILYPALNSHSPRHFYDAGLGVRYAGIDSSYLVETCQNESSEYFLSIFGLYANPSYTVFQSTADTCKINQYGSITLNQLDLNTCTHSQNCNSPSKLLADLTSKKGASSAKSPSILWTGHRTTGHGCSLYSLTTGAIIITSIDIPNYNGPMTEAYTFELHHEMSHRLGAFDHYCEGEGCENPYCDICVYGRSSVRECVMSQYASLNSYQGNSIYCADCLSRIRLYMRNNIT